MSDNLASLRSGKGIRSQRTARISVSKGETAAATASRRGVIYTRVSDPKSAEKNISIPDQYARCNLYASQNAIIVVDTFSDPGRSAKTDKRPQFQKMMRNALSEDKPYDVIIIYHTSRFARNMDNAGFNEARLLENGVEVVSVSQFFSKDIAGFMSRKLSQMFDQQHSLITSVNVRNARNRMARENLWPGGRPPPGYMLEYNLNERGVRRSRLVVDEQQRPIIKKIFCFYLYGDGSGPPMGIRNITTRLNKDGLLTRDISRWSLNAVHRILTNPVYYGEYHFNQNPNQDGYVEYDGPIIIKCPEIIDKSDFYQAQTMLQAKDPLKNPAKAISSALLLSGIARCICGSSLILRTGTGKSKKVYRYYRCSQEARKGRSDCPGVLFPEDYLNEIVLTSIREVVLEPSRLAVLLHEIDNRRRIVITHPLFPGLEISGGDCVEDGPERADIGS